MSYLRILFAFIIPPAAVYMQFGASREFVVNILLTMLGFVPGIVHAIYVMSSRRPGLVRRERIPN